MVNKKAIRTLERALNGITKAQDTIEAQLALIDSVKVLLDEEGAAPVKAKPAKSTAAKPKKEVDAQPKPKKKTSKVKSKKVKSKKPVAAD